jgi:hypothetical protein
VTVDRARTGAGAESAAGTSESTSTSTGSSSGTRTSPGTGTTTSPGVSTSTSVRHTADARSARPGTGSRSRRLLTTAAVVGMLLGVGACSPEPVRGEAFPDWDAVDVAATERFTAQMDLLDSHILESSPFTTGETTDITGVTYTHATFGEDTSAGQSVVAVSGNPASLFTQQNDPGTGRTIDMLHVGGDSWDYLLLGDGLDTDIDTPWVRFPTLYGSLGILGDNAMCYVLGFSTVCDVRDAINATEASDAGPSMRRTVTSSRDGEVLSQTEVTLQSILDAEMLSMPESLTEMLTDTMLSTLVPVNLWQDADGALLKIEMNGVVPGEGDVPDLVLQLGFEITGTAARDDVPPAPELDDVTTLSETERDDFINSLGDA